VADVVTGDAAVLATFAAGGAVLAGPVCYVAGVISGVALRRSERRNDVSPVAGYGRTQVPAPLSPHLDIPLHDPQPATEDRVAAGALKLAKLAVLDRLAAMRADRSEGWQPGELADLREQWTDGPRHAAGGRGVAP
jgi:hypothetical protein